MDEATGGAGASGLEASAEPASAGGCIGRTRAGLLVEAAGGLVADEQEEDARARSAAITANRVMKISLNILGGS